MPEGHSRDGITLVGNTLLPRACPLASCLADAACGAIVATHTRPTDDAVTHRRRAAA
jgi:hypothetical protein